MKKIKRHFSKETSEAIIERDEYCVLCGGTINQVHHIFYGALNTNYGSDRNVVNQGVGLCFICHESIHKGGDQKKRQYCINYLKEYYGL